MIRSRTLLFLVSSLVLQPIFAGAAESNLETRLRDMSGEAARFLETKAPGWAVVQAPRETTSHEPRVRAKVLELPLGSEVHFTRRSGEKVVGELTDVSETEFTVRMAASEETRQSHGHNASVRRNYRFADVRLLLGGSDPRDIPIGKTVEVRLVGGKKIKGKLTAVAEDGVTINDQRRLPFDDVLSVKTVMRNRTKALIAVGVTVPLLILVGYGIAYASGY